MTSVLWHTLTELSVFVCRHALRGPYLSHCIMHSCLVCMRIRLYCHCLTSSINMCVLCKRDRVFIHSDMVAAVLVRNDNFATATTSSFNKPEGWPRWKQRFLQFRSASGLATAPDAQQTSTLLYCLGEEAEDVLNSAGAKDADKATVDKIIKKFDENFATRRNIIYERARFNLRTQQPGESAEQFIIALYTLSEWCEYGDMREELIRDRLVVGILDSALSEKLQLDPKLDLEKARSRYGSRSRYKKANVY